MIFINETFIPIAWETALREVYENGEEYFDTIDSPLLVEIDFPISEPRLHKCLPCGLGQLKEYEFEVIKGIKDHFIGSNETAWEYTYHSRMKGQIPLVIEKLVKNYQTRQAIISIGNEKDRSLKDPPCLQYIQFRIRQNEFLDMKTHWRSRDLFKAWSMNVWAFTRFQEEILSSLKEADPKFRGLKIGKYIDISDSAHIYKQDLDIVGENLEKWGKTFSIKRSFLTNDPKIQEIFKEAEIKISNGEPIYF
jgi:thymidylate synthase